MIKNHTLFTGDNLPVMRGMESESVDLIYLDPPFNSNRIYSAPIGSKAAGAEFRDVWTLDDTDKAWHGEIADEHPSLYKVIDAAGEVGGKGDKAYLIYIAMRLLEMKRILKPTGSIYLHCDQTMSHALKMTMDSVFCSEGGIFLNEIVWYYKTGGASKKWFSKKHDTIFIYTKGNKYTFNLQKEKSYLSHKYGFKNVKIFNDNKGYYTLVNCRDVFDIPALRGNMPESTGYPTQKPITLLERIIKTSSNEDDIVLDPFCGCATTLIAAQKLNRQWIGIDISPKAVELVKQRLDTDIDMLNKPKNKALTDFIHRKDIPKRKQDVKRTKNIKHTLYGEQEGKCSGCRQRFDYRNMTIDHIIPRSKGGTDDDTNLQLLCGACNSTKGDREQSYLKARLKELNIGT
jgi:site-specific DNA-methyltransferase (adenine-specific)